jgi:signal transduction histidine kinase
VKGRDLVKTQLVNLWTHLSLARQFMLASCVVIVGCMTGVGWWVSREIQAGVIHETAATTALYMNSFVAPLVQELVEQDRLNAENMASLDNLVRDTPLGQEVLSFKIWNRNGQIVFSTNPSLIGQAFEMSQGGSRAWQGSVVSSISHLEHEEHSNERRLSERLLETYSPVRRADSKEIIAVAEFYQSVDHLEAQLARARMLSWLVVGIATLAMYVILAGIVRRGSDTIERQQRDLRDKVRQLSSLLIQNRELSERVRRAASGTTARTERFLRRISAELHDGPAQCLGLALLRLDSVIAHTETCACDKPTLRNAGADLEIVQDALREALDDIRALSAGMSLPELDNLSLPDTLLRVAHVHEQRTKTNVALDLDGVPRDAALPVKITLYRLIQEALSNAYRHAHGIEQHIRVACEADRLRVEVSDDGPGFDWRCRKTCAEHLGLEGMRERVESMGGTFRIESEPNRGTRVQAELSLQPVDGGHVG